MQLFCNEAQERYTAIIAQSRLKTFQEIAERERCSFSVVGRIIKADGATEQANDRLILRDREAPRDQPHPIDMPLSVLFGNPPKKTMTVETAKAQFPAFDSSLSTYLPNLSASDILHEAVSRVLALPTVGSKSYLITIGGQYSLHIFQR